MSLQHTLDFLRDLRFNNNRLWFNENRARYEAARSAHEQFISDVIARFSVVDDIGDLSPADTTYRINRDTRFSPDKTPYKTAIGAVIGKVGRKTTGRSYYIHIEPDGNSFVGGGLYMILPEQLALIRRMLAEDARPFRAILDSEHFKRYFGKMVGEQVKTAPKGFSKDYPDIDLLRFKQFLATHSLSDEQVLAGDLVERVIEVCTVIKPFITYLHESKMNQLQDFRL
jgi:uncharacterized protein (TIGR02453 family)